MFQCCHWKQNKDFSFGRTWEQRHIIEDFIVLFLSLVTEDFWTLLLSIDSTMTIILQDMDFYYHY